MEGGFWSILPFNFKDSLRFEQPPLHNSKKKTQKLLNKPNLNKASHNYLTLYETILLLKEFNAWLILPNLKLNLLNTHLTENYFILTTHYKFHSCLNVLNS